MKEFKLYLRVLLTPSTWSRNDKTCQEWDRALRFALSDGPEIELLGSHHTVYINGVEVWVSNYPYAYGFAYGSSKLLPARRTALILRDTLDALRIDVEKEKAITASVRLTEACDKISRFTP